MVGQPQAVPAGFLGYPRLLEKLVGDAAVVGP
jgi:hypothetical protein